MTGGRNPNGGTSAMTCSIRVRRAVLAGLTLSIASHAAPAAAPVRASGRSPGFRPRWRSSPTAGASTTSTPRTRRTSSSPRATRRPATGCSSSKSGGGGRPAPSRRFSAPASCSATSGARLHRFRGDMTTEMNHYHDRGDQIIPAFVRGINAYVDQAAADPSLLPIEFELLGITPGRWDPGGRHLAPSGAGGGTSAPRSATRARWPCSARTPSRS